jgi:hypothetical protein
MARAEAAAIVKSWRAASVLAPNDVNNPVSGESVGRV